MRGAVTNHVLLGSRSHGGPIKVGTVCVASKPGGRKDGNEYCSPEIGLSSEAVEEVIALRRPGSRMGKAEVR